MTMRGQKSRSYFVSCDVKYVKNGNSYDVGPNGDYYRLPMGFTFDDTERL